VFVAAAAGPLVVLGCMVGLVALVVAPLLPPKILPVAASQYLDSGLASLVAERIPWFD